MVNPVTTADIPSVMIAREITRRCTAPIASPKSASDGSKAQMYASGG